MARVRQTVVAVVHGSDQGAGADVEVYRYDLADAAGHKAVQLLGSWRPQPGELDDADRVKRRVAALQTAPGYSRAPRDRGATGFLTTASERDIASARAMSGGAGSPVFDESYEYQVGEVLLFDAEIDTERLEVDWHTAVPHPSTNPETISCAGPVQRFDGAVIDPHAYRNRSHRVEIRADGSLWPVNEAGEPVTGCSGESNSFDRTHEQERSRSETATRSRPPVDGNDANKGIESLLARRSSRPPTAPKGGSRQALAAIQSRTVALVRAHGPTLVEATKSKLKDPAVQAALRKALLTAVEAGLASKGGGSVKFASAASTAIRVADMVAAAQKSQTRGAAGTSGLSR